MRLLIFRLSAILLSYILLPSISSGQRIRTVETKPISNQQYLERDDLFIIQKYDSTTQILHMYMINSTDSSILLSTYRNGNSAFNLMVKNTVGDWQTVSLFIEDYRFRNFPTIVHEPDSIKMLLPSNSYISDSFPFRGKMNNLKTEVQFFSKINDQLVYSDPISIAMDSILGLTNQEKKVVSIDKYLLHEKKEKSRQHAQLEKVDVLMKLPNKEHEAYDLFSRLLLTDSKSDKVRYMKGKLLYISAIKGDKITTNIERFVLYNAVINELSKIKSTQKFSNLGRYYTRSKKAVDSFKAYKLTPSDWDVINNLKCDQSTEAEYCYLTRILKEKIAPELARQKRKAAANITNYTYISQKLSETPDIPDCKDLKDASKKQKCFGTILLNHIYKHLEYPKIARDNKIEGTVVIQVHFDNDKQTYCAKILRDIGARTGKAALKATLLAIEEILTDYKPCNQKWKPSKARGNPVTMNWNVPVKFKL